MEKHLSCRAHYHLKGRYQLAGFISLALAAAALPLPSFRILLYTLSAIMDGSLRRIAIRSRSGQREPSKAFSKAPSFKILFSIVCILSDAGTTTSATFALRRIPMLRYQSAR